jgi:hypothetical protein
MFKLNETVLVPDPVEALESENGAFLIVAPTGDTLQIRLEAGHMTIENSQHQPAEKRDDFLWTIIKIGEVT